MNSLQMNLLPEPLIDRPLFDQLDTGDPTSKPAFLEFFAGSGLVAHALKPYFDAVWANDISHKKSQVYQENHGGENFHLGSIEHIHGHFLPSAVLSWASFPCQDLSLAGMTAGINGHRSGLVWEWLRVLKEMPKMPPILVAENVIGLVSSHGGRHYRDLHRALRSLGYLAGAIVLDAIHWLPQSRPRVFVIAVRDALDVPLSLLSRKPTWLHPSAIERVSVGADGWLWWNMPKPPQRRKQLHEIIDWDAPCSDPKTARKNLALVPANHRKVLQQNDYLVAAGYKRTREQGQVLELRFDDIAGCLRTPEGGSSRQYLVIRQGGETKVRLLTVREAARLMGAPETYKLPGSYNDGYRAMGDAVAVPVARYLARHLLDPLARAVE